MIHIPPQLILASHHIGSSMRGGGVGLSMYGITGEGVSGGGGFDMSGI